MSVLYLPDPRAARAIDLLRVILTAESQEECDRALDEAEELMERIDGEPEFVEEGRE